MTGAGCLYVVAVAGRVMAGGQRGGVDCFLASEHEICDSSTFWECVGFFSVVLT